MIEGRLPADIASRPLWPQDKVGAAELKSFFERCTQDDPTSRPSAAVLLSDFQHALDSLNVN